MVPPCTPTEKSSAGTRPSNKLSLSFLKNAQANCNLENIFR